MVKKPTPKPLVKDPPSKTERMQLVISKELQDKVDRWRAKQPGLPNKSLAIRLLIEKALDES